MKILKFNSTASQNALVGAIGLFVPGMFLALNGLGAGGLEDLTINSNALTAMYIAFSITGVFFSGAINNILGHRQSIILGCCAYIIYIVSLWTYHTTLSAEFVIAAGGLMGACASLFWTAQGSIMMSYPLEHEKGHFISVFRVVYNFGGVFGALFSFGLNYHNETKEVSTSTYALFMALMVVGLILSGFISPINRVVRSDGTRVEPPQKLVFLDHLKGLKHVFTDWRMLLLSPLFLLSNFYYPYEFNTYNGTLFNVRTRSLNNALYWLMQIVAAPVWGMVLDYSRLTRKKRGSLAIIILIIVSGVVWGCGYIIQEGYSNDQLPARIDFSDSTYVPRLLVYLGYSLVDYLTQATLFWLLGALSSDPHVLARYTGYYGGIQSAGSAIAWRINALGVNFMVEYYVNVVILGLACLCTLGVATQLQDTNNTVEIDSLAEEFKK